MGDHLDSAWTPPATIWDWIQTGDHRNLHSITSCFHAFYDFLSLSSSFGKPVAPPTIYTSSTAPAPPPANETSAQNGEDAASTPPPPPPPPSGSSEDLEAPPPSPPPASSEDLEAPPPALHPSLCCSPPAPPPYLETGKHSLCLMKRRHYSMMTSQLLCFLSGGGEQFSLPISSASS